MPEKIIAISESDLRSMIAEGFHTAFRKGTDCAQAMPIHRLIAAMPDQEWSNVIDFVMSGFGGYVVTKSNDGEPAQSQDQQKDLQRVRGRLLQAEIELYRANSETQPNSVRLAAKDIALFTKLLDAYGEPWEYLLAGTAAALRRYGSES
jgi:hypothetical protein